MATEQTSDFPYHPILDEAPPEKPKSELPCLIGLLFWIIGTSLILRKTFSSLEYEEPRYTPKEITLDDRIGLVLEPKEFEISASSLKEMTFSMRARMTAEEPRIFPREAIDFVSVVDFPEAKVRSPWPVYFGVRKPMYYLGDQDRLSIVVYDKKTSGNSSNYETLSVSPFYNATKENRQRMTDEMWSDDKMSQEIFTERSNQTYKGLRTAIDILNERENLNPITGIMLYTFRCDQQDINEILQGIESKGTKTFLYCLEDPISFVLEEDPMQENILDSLNELENSLLGTIKYFVEPVQSEFFQGVEIVKAEFKELAWGQEAQNFVSTSLSLLPARQNDFLIDVKVISKVTQPKSGTKTKVKIATCKMVLTLLNGQQVVKNQDITVEIS